MLQTTLTYSKECICVHMDVCGSHVESQVQGFRQLLTHMAICSDNQWTMVIFQTKMGA